MNDVGRPRPAVPAVVAPYVECLGYDGAADFLLAFGGGELYLARDAKGKGMAEAAVGAKAVAAMAAHPRIGSHLRVPLAKKWLAAVLIWRGHSVASAARKLHASDVSVRKWVKGAQGG